VAFDYILLLGLLLFAADLGYVEAQFTVLGPRWAHHLLIVGVVYLLAAYRWDSRTVLGLALTTLAAWRCVRHSHGRALGMHGTGDLRANAIVVGGLYPVRHAQSARAEGALRAVFGNIGLLLLLEALVSSVLEAPGWRVWLAALLVVAGLVMWVSFGLGRSLYFAQGVVAAYIGLLKLLFHREVNSVGFLVAALLGIGALALIFAAHRRIAER
jgi:hypothetical protein